MKALLLFISYLFGGLTALRNWCFDSGVFRIYCPSLPVISVGNISVGGNAKTPLVILLAQELARKNIEVAILTRGYGGKLAGPVQVLATHSVADVGDEALLMAAKTGRPIVVARDRARGAQLIEAENLGSVILLDDGFQHRWLGRDLDIVTAYVGSEEAREDFVHAELLPAGRFRESRDRALRRTDVMVFSERQPVSEASNLDNKLFRLIPAGVQLYRSSFEVQGAFSLSNSVRLNPGPIVAFCGIANPDGFLESLARAGFSVVASQCFPDHHSFSSRDIHALRDAHPNLPLVCTEKDAVRLVGQEREGVHELRIAMKVMPGDAFITQVCRAILQRQARRNGVIVNLSNSIEKQKSSK